MFNRLWQRFIYLEEVTGDSGAGGGGASATTAAPQAPAPARIASSLLFGGGEKTGGGDADTTSADPAGGEPKAAPAAAGDGEADPNADKPKDEPQIKMPGKDAPPEEWDAFYKQIGKPESADQYELTVDDGGTGEFAKAIAPLLHKANVTADQAKVLNEGWNEMQKSARETLAKQEADRIAALDSKNKAEAATLANEWGSEHTANMEYARRGVTQFIDGTVDEHVEVIAALEGSIGFARTMKFFQGIGKSIGESDAAGLGGGNNGATTKSAADILYPSTSGASR